MEPDPGTRHRVGSTALRAGPLALLGTADSAPSAPALSMSGDVRVGPPASDRRPDGGSAGGGSQAGRHGDAHQRRLHRGSAADRDRLIALVELARGGDAEAFGMLYDHYHGSVYRFLYHRTVAARWPRT